MPRKIVDLKEADISRMAERTRRIRRELFKTARRGITGMQDDLGGFALVIWTRNGESHTAVNVGERVPFDEDLVPDYVRTQLHKYLAIRDFERGRRVHEIDEE